MRPGQGNRSGTPHQDGWSRTWSNLFGASSVSISRPPGAGSDAATQLFPNAGHTWANAPVRLSRSSWSVCPSLSTVRASYLVMDGIVGWARPTIRLVGRAHPTHLKTNAL